MLARDHDRQAAEDNKEGLFGIIRLTLYKSGIFIEIVPPTFRNNHRPEGFERLDSVFPVKPSGRSTDTASHYWEAVFL